MMIITSLSALDKASFISHNAYNIPALNIFFLMR